MNEGLDDCTHYEGKDGYALVDGATYEAMRRENERLRALVKESYIEGYGHLGSWVQRESSWNSSQSKKKLG